MGKRSGKFYRKNENEVMELLGFEPTKGSGSGWVEKEDGQNDNCICQLKSTDAQSIRINKLDIDKLLYHANVAHKIPVFAIQFLESNETYILVRPEDITDVAKYVKTGKRVKRSSVDADQIGNDHAAQPVRKTICSGNAAREQFRKENEQKYKKGIRSAT